MHETHAGWYDIGYSRNHDSTSPPLEQHPLNNDISAISGTIMAPTVLCRGTWCTTPERQLSMMTFRLLSALRRHQEYRTKVRSIPPAEHNLKMKHFNHCDPMLASRPQYWGISNPDHDIPTPGLFKFQYITISYGIATTSTAVLPGKTCKVFEGTMFRSLETKYVLQNKYSVSQSPAVRSRRTPVPTV